MPSPLTVTMPTDREVVLTRVFDAPRVLVFEALTTPELLRRWYGPSDWTLVVCEIDLRIGGRGGQTTYTSTILFPSREVRDTVVKSGLERGASQSYDRLADVLASAATR